MSASEHTSGPWTSRLYMQESKELAELQKVGLSPTLALSNDGQRYVMAGDKRIALVDCQIRFKRGRGHATECAERDANARLIAAAPELLALVKHLEWVTDDFEGEFCSCCLSLREDGHTSNCVLRASIAKATGEA